MIPIIFTMMHKAGLREAEAWWLLEYVTKKSKIACIRDGVTLSEQEQNFLDGLLDKIQKESIPLAYIIGAVDFLQLKVSVQPPILIPRIETEEWIANVIQELQPYKHMIRRILEIGTGTGCIALACAKAFPDAHIIATDLNLEALTLAQQNARDNNIHTVSWIQSDLFSELSSYSFDVIISNPPYIDPEKIETIASSVIDWEDHRALFADEKGLGLLKKIIEQGRDFLYLHPEMPYQLILEHDQDQKGALSALVESVGGIIVTEQDMFGQDRVSKISFR